MVTDQHGATGMQIKHSTLLLLYILQKLSVIGPRASKHTQCNYFFFVLFNEADFLSAYSNNIVTSLLETLYTPPFARTQKLENSFVVHFLHHYQQNP